jgi:periplasmic copper chaperone A
MFRPITMLMLAALPLAACDNSSAPAPAQPADAIPEDAAAAAPDGPGVGFPENAALRLSANPSAPSAVYFTISADGNQAMTITSVTSDDAQRIEMHESRRENGMMSMAQVERINVPANGQAVLRPGGLHLMVFGISERARAAGALDFTVRFANGVAVNGTATTANLAAAEGNAPAAADHGEDHSGH